VLRLTKLSVLVALLVMDGQDLKCKYQCPDACFNGEYSVRGVKFCCCSTSPSSNIIKL
jgi:hypothetical protein